MDHFEHEKLDVYKAAIEFVGVAGDIVESLPQGHGHISDQLLRASTSASIR